MVVKLLSKPPRFEYRTRSRNSRLCSSLLAFAIVTASSGCAEVQPSQSSDPIKRLDNILDSSGYFFPRPQPNGSHAYGAAFVRNPSVIKGNELPAIQGAQSYGKRMLEGAKEAQDCAKSHDSVTATACKDFVTKFCDRAQSAFALSQDETDWWRANSPKLQNQPTAAKSINQPPRLIPQTRLAACGIDKIQVVKGYDAGETSQIATSVAAKKPKAKEAAPVAAGSTGAIAAAAPAPKEVQVVIATAPPVPKEVKSVLATAPPIKNAESASLAKLPLAPEQEDAYPSEVAPQAARPKVATAPMQVPDVQVPEAGTEASRSARSNRPQVAAVSGDDFVTHETQTKTQDNKSTPTNAPTSRVKTGTFGGQLFGRSGGHTFSAGLILTLVVAGKELKGAWVAEHGKSGKVTGTLAGSKIETLRLVQLEPCAGSYDGSAVIVEDGSRLRGSYKGTDCKGQVNASFTVVNFSSL
jgi:hypothetical protein